MKNFNYGYYLIILEIFYNKQLLSISLKYNNNINVIINIDLYNLYIIHIMKIDIYTIKI